MRRKLWLIDLALVVSVIVIGTQLRDKWQESVQREQALLRQMVPPMASPTIPPLPGVSPATAAAYLEMAQMLVFSASRNPNVLLDPPPPPPAPKPMPPLPLAYGVIDLGSGPTVILSERSGAPHKGYRLGERIGEFKLLAASNQEVVFEWDGKPIRKKLEDLVDKRARSGDAPAEAASTPAGTPQPPGGVTSLSAERGGPGVELGPSTRACQPNDKSAAGTVQDGYRKVVSKTPFGESCRWEAVK